MKTALMLVSIPLILAGMVFEYIAASFWIGRDLAHDWLIENIGGDEQ
jgi:hypothetical protein